MSIKYNIFRTLAFLLKLACSSIWKFLDCGLRGCDTVILQLVTILEETATSVFSLEVSIAGLCVDYIGIDWMKAGKKIGQLEAGTVERGSSVCRKQGT
jgi:hypothetical protein